MVKWKKKLALQLGPRFQPQVSICLASTYHFKSPLYQRAVFLFSPVETLLSDSFIYCPIRKRYLVSEMNHHSWSLP